MALNVFKQMCVFVVFVCLITLAMSAMSEKQLQAAAKLYRNNCQPKSKITDELIDKMHVGTWDDDKTAKCYMYCLLSMLKLVDKNGRFNIELALPQLAALPTARISPTEISVEKCKLIGVDSSDKCDASWQFAKCFYFDNPENYFLP